MVTRSPLPSKPEAPTLAAFLDEQIATRLRRLAYELRQTRQSMDEERVHDLRVAIRRLMETVRIMQSVLPKEGAKDTLDDLRKIMKIAGEVRGCDIAIGLLQQAGAPADAPAIAALKTRRRLAEDSLYERAHHAYQRNATRKWRSGLLPRSANHLLP